MIREHKVYLTALVMAAWVIGTIIWAYTKGVC